MHVMILLHFGGNLVSFVLAHDVYTAGDSRILWSTFPVNIYGCKPREPGLVQISCYHV